MIKSIVIEVHGRTFGKVDQPGSLGNGLPTSFISGFFSTKLHPLADDAHARVFPGSFMGREFPAALPMRAPPGASNSPGMAVKKSQRKVVVFACLLGILTLTSAVLMALAPAPLAPGEANSLFAIDVPRSLDAIFQTSAPILPNHWKYIFIHQTATASGDANSLAQQNHGFGDHFLIGNGNGAVDGEIQIGQRWNQQQPAQLDVRIGDRKIGPACISICLVGNFDRTVPTPTQLRRLKQLVETLQGQLHISSNDVFIPGRPNSSAGVGKYFPAAAFRSQLLP